MKIAFVGYGKMGHMMEEIARARGNEVVATIDPFAPDASHKVASGDKAGLVNAIKESGAEGIIEFSHPTAVMGNIEALLPLKLLEQQDGTTKKNMFHSLQKIVAELL